jgi:hypothetical protein
MSGWVAKSRDEMMAKDAVFDGRYNPDWGPIYISDGGQQVRGIQRAMKNDGQAAHVLGERNTPSVILYADNLSKGDKALVNNYYIIRSVQYFQSDYDVDFGISFWNSSKTYNYS